MTTTAPSPPAEALAGLGLVPYKAKVLAALVEVGDGDSRELAGASTVPRTSVYLIAESLVAGGLAQRVERRRGPMAWSIPGEGLAERWGWLLGQLRSAEYRRHHDRLAALDGLRRRVLR